MAKPTVDFILGNVLLHSHLLANDLKDVVISLPADNQALMYEAATQKWKNKGIPAGITSHAALTELDYASAAHTGFEPTVTKGNLTESTSSVLTIGSGTGAVIGAGTTIQVAKADASTDGYLAKGDFSTFAAKEPAVTKGNLTEATSSVLTITGGNNAVIGTGTSIEVDQADSGNDGYLSSADWTNFNSKLPGSIATDTYFVTGFTNRSESTISFNNGTTTFTIAPTGANYSFYSASTKYTKSLPINLDLSTVTGWSTNKMIFIYFDTTGTIQGSITPWSIISANAPIATVFWNGTNGALADERHTAGRNLAWHDWSHKTVGARYISGLQGTFTSAATTIALGSFADDDITFNYGQQTSVVIWKTAPGGTTFTFDSTPVATTASIVAGALKWDNAGTVTNVTSGYFIRNFIYVSNVTANPIACVVAQSEHANLADCRDSALPTFPTYISNENKLIYSVCWQNVGGTPTFVESTDYRTSPSTANGGLAIRPIFLNDLEDTIVGSPNVDDTLRFNGVDWVNGPPAASSASAGIEFFLATPNIIAASAENSFAVNTLSKTPVTTAEQTVALSIATATTPMVAWLYNTALGRTSIDAGTWDFDTYAGVSSVAAGRVSTITRQVYAVLPEAGGVTVTMTSTGTSRTVTASGGTPFATTKIDASATNTTASYLQTPKGLYQITARTSDTVVTIAVPAGYTNESTVAFSVWKKLFGSTSPTITAISPAYALYQHTSTQSAFTITTTTKLGSITFGTSNNTTTITVTYNGTTRNSHMQTPLITLHGNLAGLQGGTGSVPTEEYYHLTAAQHTVVGNTSGTNSGDVTLATDSGLALSGQVLNMGTPSTVTNATTNSVTTNTHTHAVSGLQASLSVASSAEVDTGTDNAKYVTAAAISGSHNVPNVVPGTSGHVMTSDGTDWVSSPPATNGTVTDVSVVTANGVSGSVATSTTTPAITLTLGDITPTSVNALKLSATESGTTTLVGVDAGKNLVAGTTSNTFVGNLAGQGKAGSVTSAADYNTALGHFALRGLISGKENTAVGYASLFDTDVTGDRNTAVGFEAGFDISSGDNNTALGSLALSQTSTGSGNIGIGYAAGFYETGSNAFYVNNQDRTNTAGDKSKSLLYGVMAALAANQTLMVNGVLSTSVVGNSAGNVVTIDGTQTLTNKTIVELWTEVIGTTQALAVNNGYILNNAGLVTATLPSTAAVGSVIRIVGKGAGGWKVAQNASQFINFGNQVTTTGTGGSLSSVNQYDCVELLCTTANNGWIVLSSVGNITVV